MNGLDTVQEYHRLHKKPTLGKQGELNSPKELLFSRSSGRSSLPDTFVRRRETRYERNQLRANQRKRTCEFSCRGEFLPHAREIRYQTKLFLPALYSTPIVLTKERRGAAALTRFTVSPLFSMLPSQQGSTRGTPKPSPAKSPALPEKRRAARPIRF